MFVLELPRVAEGLFVTKKYILVSKGLRIHKNKQFKPWLGKIAPYFFLYIPWKYIFWKMTSKNASGQFFFKIIFLKFWCVRIWYKEYLGKRENLYLWKKKRFFTSIFWKGPFSKIWIPRQKKFLKGLRVLFCVFFLLFIT